GATGEHATYLPHIHTHTHTHTLIHTYTHTHTHTQTHTHTKNPNCKYNSLYMSFLDSPGSHWSHWFSNPGSSPGLDGLLCFFAPQSLGLPLFLSKLSQCLSVCHNT